MEADNQFLLGGDIENSGIIQNHSILKDLDDLNPAMLIIHEGLPKVKAQLNHGGFSLLPDSHDDSSLSSVKSSKGMISSNKVQPMPLEHSSIENFSSHSTIHNGTMPSHNIKEYSKSKDMNTISISPHFKTSDMPTNCPVSERTHKEPPKENRRASILNQGYTIVIQPDLTVNKKEDVNNNEENSHFDDSDRPLGRK